MFICRNAEGVRVYLVTVMGLRLGGRGKTKKGAPLMTLSYSAKRDTHFRSSLRYGHRRIRSSDYGMTDIAED